MKNQNDLQTNPNESEHIIPETSRIKMRIFNIACILLFAAGIAFIICFFDQGIHYKEVIIISAIAVMVTIILCFLKARTKITAVKFVALIIAGIVLAANWYIYFRYIPKYGPLDACAIVNADPKYASAIVEPQFFCPDKAYPEMRSNVLYELEDNPFCDWGYILNVVSDGKVTAWLAFDPATGKYELFYEPKD